MFRRYDMLPLSPFAALLRCCFFRHAAALRRHPLYYAADAIVDA